MIDDAEAGFGGMKFVVNISSPDDAAKVKALAEESWCYSPWSTD